MRHELRELIKPTSITEPNEKALKNKVKVFNKKFNSNAHAFKAKFKSQSDGWVEHLPYDPTNILYDRTVQRSRYGMKWRINIPLYPDQENLAKASKVIADTLAPFNLHFRVRKFNQEYKKTKWDASLASEINQSYKKHRMGTECQLFMRWSSSKRQFQYSPEDYKHIVLVLIKSLFDQNIRFAYTTSPYGSRSVDMEEGLMPLASYNALRELGGPFDPMFLAKVRRENPLGFEEDPLAGIKISKKDLEEYGIDEKEINKIFFDQTSNMKKHSDKSIENTVELLNGVRAKANSSKSVKPNEVFDDDNMHSLFQCFNYLVDDYHENLLAKKIFAKEGFENDFEMIRKLIAADYKKMEIIYVRLIHICHELQALTKSPYYKDLLASEYKIELLKEAMDSLSDKYDALKKVLTDLITEAESMESTKENLEIKNELYDKITDVVDYFSAIEKGKKPKKSFEEVTLNLQAIAKKLDGAGAHWKKVLGYTLIISSVILGVGGALAFGLTFGLSTFVSIPSIAIATSLGTFGASLIPTSVGAGFAYSSRDKGLAKSAYSFIHEANKANKNLVSNNEPVAPENNVPSPIATQAES